jgi:hypothetical protein
MVPTGHVIVTEGSILQIVTTILCRFSIRTKSHKCQFVTKCYVLFNFKILGIVGPNPTEGRNVISDNVGLYKT